MGASFSTSTIFRGVDRMSPVMDKMSRRTSRFGDTLKAVLSANIITAGFNRLLTGLTDGIQTMADFETAMAKVSTIADETTQSFVQQEKEMIKLSNALGLPALELAEAQYQAISAGVSDSVDALRLVETASKTAIGGFTDTTTAVDGLTTILNAYAFEAKQATIVSDQLIATQNFGKTTFGDMAQSLGNVVPIAAALKLETFELFGSIAALTKQGIKTPQAMTGIKAALSNILKPAEQASKLAEKLGLDFSATALQSKGLAGFLDDMTLKTGGSQEQMSKLFGSVEALNTVMALTANGGQGLVDAIDAIKNSTGSTDAAFERMSNTLGFRFGAVKNRFVNFSLTMADSLSPLFDVMLDIAEKVDFDKLNNQLTGFVSGLNLEGVADKMIQFIDDGIAKIPIIVSQVAELMPEIKVFASQMGLIVGFIAEGVVEIAKLTQGPLFAALKFGAQGGVIGAIKRKFGDKEELPQQEAPNQAEAGAQIFNFNQSINASNGINIDSSTSVNGAPQINRQELTAQ